MNTKPEENFENETFEEAIMSYISNPSSENTCLDSEEIKNLLALVNSQEEMSNLITTYLQIHKSKTMIESIFIAHELYRMLAEIRIFKEDTILKLLHGKKEKVGQIFQEK